MQEAQHSQDGTSVAALKHKRRADNTSGYTGVSRRQNGKWQATIRFKHKFYSLGCYDALSDAVRARKLGEALHDEFLQSYFAEHPEHWSAFSPASGPGSARKTRFQRVRGKAGAFFVHSSQTS